MTTQFPEFGLHDSEVEYILRPGGYALIFNGAGEVAIVSAPGGLFLPGGGQSSGETPEQAAVREAREECGLRISPGRCIGVADELVFAEQEGTHYRKRCAFFLAEIIEQLVTREPGHDLIWLAPEAAVEKLRHESQRWAVSASCLFTDAAPVEVSKSPIHGRGVYARRAFQAGATVMRWDTSHRLTKEESASLPDEERRYTHPFDENTTLVVQPPERYVNHSCDHNTMVRDFCDVAVRDISPGEEITSDYSSDGAGLKFKCSCGARNCRGVVG